MVVPRLVPGSALWIMRPMRRLFLTCCNGALFAKANRTVEQLLDGV
jgi:hypothetical protein